MVGLLGRKVGMTRIFNEEGRDFPVTVLEVGPCYVTQIKTESTDGYSSVQLGFKEKKEARVSKPLLGHFAKAKVKQTYVLREFRDFELAKVIQLGETIDASIFTPGDVVSISSKSKGKGFQGV